jgi:hypothetical protein
MSKSFLANVFPLHLHAYNLSSIFPVSSMSWQCHALLENVKRAS